MLRRARRLRSGCFFCLADTARRIGRLRDAHPSARLGDLDFERHDAASLGELPRQALDLDSSLDVGRVATPHDETGQHDAGRQAREHEAMRRLAGQADGDGNRTYDAHAENGQGKDERLAQLAATPRLRHPTALEKGLNFPCPILGVPERHRAKKRDERFELRDAGVRRGELVMIASGLTPLPRSHLHRD